MHHRWRFSSQILAPFFESLKYRLKLNLKLIYRVWLQALAGFWKECHGIPGLRHTLIKLSEFGFERTPAPDLDLGGVQGSFASGFISGLPVTGLRGTPSGTISPIFMKNDKSLVTSSVVEAYRVKLTGPHTLMSSSKGGDR